MIMIFLKYRLENGKHRVYYINYAPLNDGTGRTLEELEKEENSIIVETIPQPEIIEGKEAILYINPETKDMWYEYVDMPISYSPETEIEKLKAQIIQIQNIINTFVLGI